MEDKIVVHSTYYNGIEANIIKGRLEDSDIPCFLTDEHISTIQPLYNQAVGGIKLNIFEKDVERVNLLLADEVITEAFSEEEIDAELVCEKCNSNNIGFGQATKKRFSFWVTIVSLLLLVYPFKAEKCYHCYNCGHEFK
ncbi:MAG: DUF2007 domain-containing protein [Pedobacter sp.]|nr:MAG: DUF2007 domain-containing protein [Pedobacter sp.]